MRKNACFLSKNCKKMRLFVPLFCTPLRELFEMDNSYLVSRESYLVRRMVIHDPSTLLKAGFIVRRKFYRGGRRDEES